MYILKSTDVFKLIKLSNDLSIKILNDPYLSEKTNLRHYKLVFKEENFIFSKDIAEEFIKIVKKLNGVIFTEFISNKYELLKLVQYSGFKFNCPSMAWISTVLPKDTPSVNCKLISIDLFDKYKERIEKIAQSFDTSRYEHIDFYKPFIKKMYQDKVINEWKTNKELIIYFRKDNPIAFTTLSFEDEKGWLLTSCVDPLYRGGRAYYEMILKSQEILLKEKKKKCVKVECIASNIVVQKTWHKLGFKPNYSTVVFYYATNF